MAHSKSALKRWRQHEARNARNRPVLSAARTSVKKARLAITEGGDDAPAAIREAARIVDKAAKRNVIHPNAAARHKSRLMKALNKAAGGAATAEAPKKGRKAPAKGKTAAKKPAAKRATAKSKKN